MKATLLILTTVLANLGYSQNDCQELRLENERLKSELAKYIDTAKHSVVKSFDPAFNVRLVNVTGNKEAQTVDVELVFSHEKVHQEVCINVGSSDCKVYDANGTVYDTQGGIIGMKACKNLGSSKYSNSYACEKVPTSVPVKVKLTIRKVLPQTSEFDKLLIKIGFRDADGGQYNYGELELDSLVINWK